MKSDDILADLERRAELGGGEARRRKQHQAGKLSARERIELLFDPGTFEELDKLVTTAASTSGWSNRSSQAMASSPVTVSIDGRQVFAFAQDFTVFGGSLSETNAAKIVKIMDLAMKLGSPIVGLNDSGGARIQEGVLSLGGHRRHLPPQYPGVGRRAADLGDHGPVRRRRSLLASDYGFHVDGERHELHVRDWPGRHQDGDARGRHQGGARRSD